MTSSVLLETTRSFRPFKSSEEYLYAMKEDLAEWLQTMYPHLNICVENFMERLETGVALCEHANAVKIQAQEYALKKKAKMVMTRSITGSLLMAQDLVRITEVKFFNTAKPGTFFARDNVSNFINWCRNALRIIECLLFESDDLIMRKNEKHVILCLLEVARRGAKFGMPAPMLVQMERQIDREIAADQKKMSMSLHQNDSDESENKFDDDSDSDMEDEETVLMYGPAPQIITNDLKCLDDMVRDLVEQCTCPTQFPMIKVSDGKYRIGDTKVLIFVRVLRNHVMVRVGGGWDTLAHYLDKHDPCRCRSQHRTTQGAKLVNRPGTNDLQGSHVYYNRAPLPSDPASAAGHVPASSSPATHSLGPPMNSLNRSRSRSPSTAAAAASNSYLTSQINGGGVNRRSVSPNTTSSTTTTNNKFLLTPADRRSRSPTPNFTSTTYLTKLSNANNSKENQRHNSISNNTGPQSLPIMGSTTTTTTTGSTPKGSKQLHHHVSSLKIEMDPQVLKSEAVLHIHDTDQSDSTSELSDEGYRSLGIVQDKSKQQQLASASLNQNALDAVDSEHQQIYTGDDLNDCGLRKTQYSYIYENDIRGKLESNLKSVENLAELSQQISSPKPTTKPANSLIEDTNSQPPTKKSSMIPSQPKENGLLKRKERSFVATTATTRSNSGPKSLPQPKKGAENSKISTWSGRPKNARSSLTNDTFVSPFNRNSAGRRSTSILNSSRRSSSAHSSPTKSKLKQELLEAVKQTDDDTVIVEQVQELLKRYRSLSTLDNDEDYVDSDKKDKDSSNLLSFVSPRKEQRTSLSGNKSNIPLTNGSRIPAPRFFSKV